MAAFLGGSGSGSQHQHVESTSSYTKAKPPLDDDLLLDDERSLQLDTTLLAEGYTDDGRLSRYDNLRWNVGGESKRGKKPRFEAVKSPDSSRSSPTSSLLDSKVFKSSYAFSNAASFDNGDGEEEKKGAAKATSKMVSSNLDNRYFLHTDIPVVPRRKFTVADVAAASPLLSPASASRTVDRNFTSVATGCFAKVKVWYDHSVVRHFAPFILLGLYAVLGACVFYLIEHNHEVYLIKLEKFQLEELRNTAFFRLRRLFGSSTQMIRVARSLDAQQRGSGEILRWYEKQFMRIKLPETLEWDAWGAMFFVGSVFTTIGYGNITARTTAGQALSILYAIIGIPLVLAILSQFSKKMTRFFSNLWIKYRQTVIDARIKASLRRASLNPDLEKGKHSEDKPEEDNIESRTIPVWLALSLCIGYICLIAGIFLVWETRWTYFTSFYFICISCLTIGLGDVTPNHPRMLILMFIFVIIGLSFVSVLISVIQIKMEEWLYRMMIKMHKELQKQLDETVDHEDRERIVQDLLKNEPWYMRNFAPMIVSSEKAEKIEHMAEMLREVNNKNVQTEGPFIPVEIDWKPALRGATGAESAGGLMKTFGGGPSAATVVTWEKANAGDLISAHDNTAPMHSAQEEFSGWAPIFVEHMPISSEILQHHSGRGSSAHAAEMISLTTISEAASLPTDPTKLVRGSSRILMFTENNNETTVRQDRSMQVDETSHFDRSIQTELAQFQIDEIALKMKDFQQEEKEKEIEAAAEKLQVKVRKSSGAQVKPVQEDKSVGTTDLRSFETKSAWTEVQEMVSRSMETQDNELWRGEDCVRSRSTQTMFDDDDDDDDDDDEDDDATNSCAKQKRLNFTTAAGRRGKELEESRFEEAS